MPEHDSPRKESAGTQAAGPENRQDSALGPSSLYGHPDSPIEVKAVFPDIGKFSEQRGRQWDRIKKWADNTFYRVVAGKEKGKLIFPLPPAPGDLKTNFRDVSITSEELKRVALRLFFPPHYSRFGIREIARQLDVDHAYISRLISKCKREFAEAIDLVRLRGGDQNIKKEILRKYFLEQHTQAETAATLGKRQRDVQRTISQFRRTVLESGVFASIADEYSAYFFYSNV
jgi:hypothetical protein